MKCLTIVSLERNQLLGLYRFWFPIFAQNSIYCDITSFCAMYALVNGLEVGNGASKRPGAGAAV